MNVRSRLAPVLAIVAVAASCAAPKRPTVTGADLYARVEALRTTGQVTVGTVAIRKDQVLTTGRDGQVFVVGQVIEDCRGGDPTLDVDCTLALLVHQRFTVHDRHPARRDPKPEDEDRSGSALTAITVLGLGAAATGGLVYGIATCEFEGCEVVFGVPLVFIGVAALFALGH